ncbi:DUF6228 family protein [Streptomyces sp. NBC_00708]
MRATVAGRERAGGVELPYWPGHFVRQQRPVNPGALERTPLPYRSSMTTPDVARSDGPCVTIRCRDNPAIGVEFSDRFGFDQDSVHYAVELQAPGLTARVDEVVAWIWDSDLYAFLEELAADYRGWHGERTWHNNDRDLTVSAVFRSGGHVGLTWTARPWPEAQAGWSASVTTWSEAGEQMASLAADIRRFLTGGPR